ncbi:MAG TPA: amidohydrolase family protein [Pelomicrobium sp.]|nr:amidohydrolase family protein [Pelomicrobium sp.]
MKRWLAAAAMAAATTTAAAEPLALFDAHLHYNREAWAEVPPAQALRLIEQAGIRRAVVSSTPDEGTLELYALAPERIVPVLRPYRTDADRATWYRDPAIVAYLEERLQRGVHRGIGEFHVHGDAADTAVVGRIVELAVARDLVLYAHSDERAVEILFAKNPRARVLWAHAGMNSEPDAVSRMLDRFPNLWVELSIRGDVAPAGALDPQWRALFVRHPDRFLYGTDTYVTSRWHELPGIAEAARRWLGQLPPEVARRIAYQNGERLFPPR